MPKKARIRDAQLMLSSWCSFVSARVSIGVDLDAAISTRRTVPDIDAWHFAIPSRSRDWDDDGDGWSDDDEMLCGTNHLDYGEIPVDLDGDMLCDDLDNDLDNDGAINPLNNCEYYLAWGDNASFIDCIADGFHAVDANGDGVLSQNEMKVFVRKFLVIEPSEDDAIIDIVDDIWD